MSVSAMIAGRLASDPARRQSKAGRAYVVADLRAANGAQWELWRCIGMTSAAREAMLGHRRGDRVTVQGTPSIKAEIENGEPTISRTLFIDAVIGLRPKARRSKARSDPGKTSAPLLEMASASEDGGPSLDDPLPF